MRQQWTDILKFPWRPPSPPRPSATNPGLGHEAKCAFANAQRSWEEYSNLSTGLADVLNEKGHRCAPHRNWVQLGKWQLQPQVVSVTPKDQGGMQTTSTIEVSHPQLLPRGLFEYQHSFGDGVHQSFCKGFESWVESDLPVFLDFEKEQPEACMALNFPASGDTAAVSRRALLAPPIHCVESATKNDEEHCFCACCLVTRNFDAFRPFMTGHEVTGIRLFAARDSEGVAQADCRVNGEDYRTGAEALLAYVRTWPDRGFEYRKQYVLIHNRTASAPASPATLPA